ncbi:MAG: hypothetical protein ACFCD0_03815 [Gemmataceae bacterium]
MPLLLVKVMRLESMFGGFRVQAKCLQRGQAPCLPPSSAGPPDVVEILSEARGLRTPEKRHEVVVAGLDAGGRQVHGYKG